MRTTLRERRRRTDDLRIIVRADPSAPSGAPKSPDSPDSVDGVNSPDSPDSPDSPGSPGSPASPDSPSPAASTFPPPPPAQTSIAGTTSIQSNAGPATTIAPVATQSSVAAVPTAAPAASLSSITTQPLAVPKTTPSSGTSVTNEPLAAPITTRPAAAASPDTSLLGPSTTTTFATSVITSTKSSTSSTSTLNIAQSSFSATPSLVSIPTDSPQNGQAQVVQSTDGGDLSKPSQIGLGTSGAAAFVAILFFVFWRFRRRRNRSSSSKSFFPKQLHSPPKSEPERDMRQANTTNRRPDSRTPSNIMDELMTAAYAVEDGDNTFGNSQQQQVQQSHYQQPQQPRYDMYADDKQQFDSGSYSQHTTLALPSGARMPPPRALSIAAKTEMTSETESTWRTWGVSQERKPSENWVDKFIRNGGVK
ncbi:hypothetical protein F4775DRAFT_474471 [Biscogniauxia sp. FL1348]|nr:hypothetical protein F4775DRAFT_474471 [Biscogniauxia sp. FL1348]